MRIFFDDAAFHIERRGGVSRYITLLARLLAESGEAEVHIFGGWHCNAFLRQLGDMPGLRVYGVQRPERLRINGLARKVSAVWRRAVASRVCREPTIYHGSFYPLDPRVAKLARATVCTLYDMIPEIREIPGRSADRYRSNKLQAARLADRMVAISEVTPRDAEQFYPGSRERTTVVPLTTELFRIPSSRQPLCAEARRYFLMVGKRSGYKNGELAYRAFAALCRDRPELRLVLCGGPLRPEELREVAELGLADRIVRIEPDDAALRSHYENALGLLYPSRHEGFGLPVLEAMLCGCPVVTCPLTSLPEVGGDAVLYNEPDDVAGCTAHMRELLDPATHQAWGDRGRARAELFRPELHVARMLAFYRTLGVP